MQLQINRSATEREANMRLVKPDCSDFASARRRQREHRLVEVIREEKALNVYVPVHVRLLQLQDALENTTVMSQSTNIQKGKVKVQNNDI